MTTPTTFAIAVVNPRLTDAQRLAQAVDAVSGRADLVRPLEVMVNAAVAVALGEVAGVTVAGYSFIPASDFRFAKVAV